MIYTMMSSSLGRNQVGYARGLSHLPLAGAQVRHHEAKEGEDVEGNVDRKLQKHVHAATTSAFSSIFRASEPKNGPCWHSSTTQELAASRRRPCHSSRRAGTSRTSSKLTLNRLSTPQNGPKQPLRSPFLLQIEDFRGLSDSKPAILHGSHTRRAARPPPRRPLPR